MFFFVYYAYDTTTVRGDGYNPSMYEFATLMCISAVWAANLYNGLNTHAWNWWVLFAVAFGSVLIVLYTLIYSAISPGWIWTYVYGNNHYLWRSAIFWFGWVFTLIVALAPRYIVRYVKENYYGSDVDILKYLGKYDPKHDYYSDPLIPGGLQQAQRMQQHDAAAASEGVNRADAGHDITPILTRTRTDMSGRAVSTRGFAFDQADGMGETTVGRPLRTWTSRSSVPASQRGMPPTTRPRSGSVKKFAQALGFPTRTNPSTAGATRKKSFIFGARKRSNTRGSAKSAGSTGAPDAQQQHPPTLPEESYAGEVPPNRPEIPDPTQAS